ncbi:MAG: hypothetical protein A3H98_11975 [Bacteroidetes bacterium RIFCSPLOWO2_02_FULL_36_8]|nr:MAG: hypothetical protein A3H98_11975 [Bacteroidetes bacterium RIFCSPLOWO2_02_FULL_36_8]OFY69567.1 MAG: hypothetical protein A3G23_11055 [Bacteroidetes bacterium RIFCSPLOWO2_12_FULL_37_12]
MKKSIIAFCLTAVVFISFYSCNKDDEDPDADKALYDATKSGGYTFYQNGNLLTGASPSPHGSFKLRFNSTALAALDSTGELSAGKNFPTGSIIVKDVYSGSNISLYAVMQKDPSNKNSGSGWVWAEYKTDGSVAFSAGKKGDGCTGCHSGTPNRDFTRTFDLH